MMRRRFSFQSIHDAVGLARDERSDRVGRA